MRLLRFISAIVLLGLALTAAAVMSLRVKYPAVEGWNVRTLPDPAFATLDPAIEAGFMDSAAPDEARYNALFAYLLSGLAAYRSDTGARVFYPGDPSIQGRSIDGLEGFSRMAPLLAAWLHGGRSNTVVVPEFGTQNLLAILQTGIENGTNPDSPAYWGDYDTKNQRYVEAADIALTVWLTRDTLWAGMDDRVKRNLVAWLMQSQSGPTDWRFNNWRLFGLIVNRVLKDLEQPVDDLRFANGWQRTLEAHAGAGWFRDSANSDFDYYNAWSFHYALYWLTRIDPSLDIAEVRTMRREFVEFYRHLMTPAGIPILGRSACYRTAAAVPLIMSVAANDNVLGPGEARRALDTSWQYFIDHGALANGALTQGYCGADRRVMQEYSGPGSCLWGARSLVVAYSLPTEHAFWTAKQAPLPVERGDFSLTSEATGWRVSGSQDNLAVTIHKPQHNGNPPLKPYRYRNKTISWLLQRPFGLGNKRAASQRASYSSNKPYTGCIQSMQTSTAK